MEKSERSIVQRAISLLVTLALILSVLLCVYVTVQVLSDGYVNVGGFMMFRVVTGSMEPTIHVGSLLMTRQADIMDIQVDDIVCFRTQEADIWGKIVTHRVVDVISMSDGSRLLETKGDANLIADGYYVSSDNLVGKVVWYTGDDSAVAAIFSFFTNEVGFLACIVMPCLLLVGFILKDCVKNIKEELAAALEEAEKLNEEEVYDWKNDPLCGMTQEEYNEMYERIRAELIAELEELMRVAEGTKTE